MDWVKQWAVFMICHSNVFPENKDSVPKANNKGTSVIAVLTRNTLLSTLLLIRQSPYVTLTICGLQRELQVCLLIVLNLNQ